MKPDAGVHAHLEGAGVDVTVGPGAGYAQMMASPENSVAPAEVFAPGAARLIVPYVGRVTLWNGAHRAGAATTRHSARHGRVRKNADRKRRDAP